MYDGIQGFTYEWGYNYDVSFTSQKTMTQNADSSNSINKLITIHSKTPADNKTFSLNLSKDSRNEFSSDYTSFTILGQRKINCSASLCKQLEAKLNQLEKNKSIKTLFRIVNSTNDLIELVSFE